MDFFIEKKGSLETVQGIIFLDQNGVLVETEPRKPPEELDAIPWPDITLTNDYKHYGLLPILTGRGCPFGCTFCYEGANAKRVRGKGWQEFGYDPDPRTDRSRNQAPPLVGPTQ